MANQFLKLDFVASPLATFNQAAPDEAASARTEAAAAPENASRSWAPPTVNAGWVSAQGRPVTAARNRLESERPDTERSARVEVDEAVSAGNLGTFVERKRKERDAVGGQIEREATRLGVKFKAADEGKKTESLKAYTNADQRQNHLSAQDKEVLAAEVREAEQKKGAAKAAQSQSDDMCRADAPACTSDELKEKAALAQKAERARGEHKAHNENALEVVEKAKKTVELLAVAQPFLEPEFNGLRLSALLAEFGYLDVVVSVAVEALNSQADVIHAQTQRARADGDHYLTERRSDERRGDDRRTGTRRFAQFLDTLRQGVSRLG